MPPPAVIGALGVAALGASVAAAWLWNVRPTLTKVDAELPAGFADTGFSHDALEDLLRRFVDDTGRVRYEAWHHDAGARVELDRYLAAVGRYSPESHPARFESDADRLAYWMYAYNAFVLKAVLDRWPLESVTEVRAPVEVVTGLGFFYTLRFVAGGKAYSLYDLEKLRIREDGKDPRIHFVLSCASGSCPVVRPRLPTGDALEGFLAEAARDFVSNPVNVTIDHDARTLTLSKIFEWYEEDFAAELRRQGRPTDHALADYVRDVAPPEFATELERARDYAVSFHRYDWSINGSRG